MKKGKKVEKEKSEVPTSEKGIIQKSIEKIFSPNYKPTKEDVEMLEKRGIETLDFKEQKRKIDIQEILKTEKPKFKSIGIGVNNGVFYYGFPYFKNGKQRTAIVTSDKKIYLEDEIRDKFNLSYRFPLYADCIDFFFSNKAINEWVFEDPKIMSLKEIFKRIRDINKKYIFHISEEYHDFVALDIISNWIYVLFENKGRTFIHAEKRSGKTRQLYIYLFLSFNPILSPNISGASFYRIIESTGGTLLIDDFDDQEEEQQRSVTQSIRVGYKKHQKAIRSEGKENIPKGFNLFAPVVFNNIGGTDATTQDRCNTLRMIRNKNVKIVNQKLEKEKKVFDELRDQLFLWALSNWKEVEKTYEELQTEELTGRDLERIEGCLVIAKMINKKLFQSQLNFWKGENEQITMKDLSGDWKFLAFEKLNEILGPGENTEKWISTKEVMEEVMPLIYSSDHPEFEKMKRRIARYIGKVFSTCPLFKKRRIGSGTEYLIRRNDLNYYTDVYDYPIDLHTQHTQHTLHTQHTQHTPPPKGSSVGSVVSVYERDQGTKQVKPEIFFNPDTPKTLETFEKQLNNDFGPTFKDLSSDLLHTWKKTGKIAEVKPNNFILVG